jgi:transcriptional regulator with XRE-family HTH domain
VERGIKEPSADVLESIAKGLGISTIQLIGEIYTYLQEEQQ